MGGKKILSPFVIYKCAALSIRTVERDERDGQEIPGRDDWSIATGLHEFRGSGENQLKGLCVKQTAP